MVPGRADRLVSASLSDDQSGDPEQKRQKPARAGRGGERVGWVGRDRVAEAGEPVSERGRSGWLTPTRLGHQNVRGLPGNGRGCLLASMLSLRRQGGPRVLGTGDAPAGGENRH